MSTTNWQPSGSVEALQQGAKLRSAVRNWMAEQSILEVVTPVLSIAAATDSHIESFRAEHDGASVSAYLHTSPEFAMKRLLAAYCCDVYQLAPVFRVAELGRYHNPEFTLLEWYRVDIDHHQLMNEVTQLLHSLADSFDIAWLAPEFMAYWDVVESLMQLSVSAVDVDSIARYFTQHQRFWPQAIGHDLDAALDLLLDEFWLPSLPTDRLTFLVDYPATQAALARKSVNDKGHAIADRFEVYLGKLELANGFHELTDAREQLARFEADNRQRQQRQQSPMPIDRNLLAALEHGLPACAGVAVGIERLLMALTGATHINQVMAFDFSRA